MIAGPSECFDRYAFIARYNAQVIKGRLLCDSFDLRHEPLHL